MNVGQAMRNVCYRDIGDITITNIFQSVPHIMAGKQLT